MQSQQRTENYVLRIKGKIIFIVLFAGIFCFNSSGQQFVNTIKYDSSKPSPKATLDVLKWLPGLWEGEAFGGITQEMWAPASGGSMMCAFKLVNKGAVSFYELVTIVEEKGTLLVRLKHFHGTLKGWEEKDNTIDFRLVKMEENKIYFDEFTFEKISPGEMNIYVVISSANGKNEEVKFNYKRKPLP